MMKKKKEKGILYLSLITMAILTTTLNAEIDIGNDNLDIGKASNLKEYNQIIEYIGNDNLDIGKASNLKEYYRMLEYIKNNNPKAKDIIETKKLKDGDIISCVDVYSQSALKKLKGKLKFQPDNLPKELKSNESTVELNDEKSIDISNTAFRVDCPKGTIPKKKLLIEDLKRFKTIEDFKSKDSKNKNIENPKVSSNPHEYAVVGRTINNRGAKTDINVWSPYVEKNSEFSLSQLWASRGSGSNLETVEAGIQKYKNKYGDYRSHLFIYFTPDNYGSGGCYNLDCNEFVQTNNSVYIGGGFNNYSSDGGNQYHISLQFYKDGKDGNWWLKYGNTWVGYYPKSLFDSNGISSYASMVEYGGEIINYGNSRHTKTDMGSGKFPSAGWKHASFQKNIGYYNLSQSFTHLTNNWESVTKSSCYDIDFTQNNGSSWGSHFYFGGPGYHSVNCP